jgi:hypothetical protein
MGRMPWFAFYPADWLSDASLASCSPYARGVWIDLLAVAYQCDPAGILATDSKPWSDERIARSIRGGSVSENLAALNELLDAGVARRMGFNDLIPGAIYSKRMVNDMQERDRNSRNTKAFRERKRSVSGVSSQCKRNVSGRVESEKSREEQRREEKTVPTDSKSEITNSPAQDLPWSGWDRWDELVDLLAPMTPHRDVYRSKFEAALSTSLHNATRAGLDPEVHQDPQSFLGSLLKAAMAAGKVFQSARGFESFALAVTTRCVESRCMPDQWPDLSGNTTTQMPDTAKLIASAKKKGAARYE